MLDLSLLITDSGEERAEFLIVDRHGVLLLDAYDEVSKYIHVVGERIERSIVGRELGVNRTIVHVLGGHVEEMIGSLKIIPVLLQTAILTETDTFADRIELLESLVLKLVAEPCGSVACLVGP